MVTFNLFPWRKYKRIADNKNYLAINLSVLMFVVIMIVSLHVFLLNQKSEIKMHIDALNNTLKKFTIFQPLIKNQTQMINDEMLMNKAEEDEEIKKLINELSKPFAADVCFTKILHKKNMDYFDGIISSIDNLMKFFTVWKALDLFSEIYIKKLKEENNLIRFSLVGKEKGAQHGNE